MAKKNETTLRCIVVLTVIAVCCGLILAILHPFLFTEPSADELINFFEAEGEVEASVEQLDLSLVNRKDGKVLLVARIKNNGNEYIGLMIKTNSDGQLGECTYAIYFDVKTNKLIQARYIKDGTTAGRTYKDYGDKGENFDDYMVVVDKADLFVNYDYPRTGATKTLRAVNNAFIIAANYYYNQYVLKGGA